MARRTTTLDLHVHRETDSAWLVSDDGDEDGAVWLPKSQCEQLSPRGQHPSGRRGPACEFEVPEWLAKEKGLI